MACKRSSVRPRYPPLNQKLLLTSSFFVFLPYKHTKTPGQIQQTIGIKGDLPFGLRFLRGINFSPPSIVAKSRNSRNKLEHSYIRPTDGEVSDAVELAELFIMATESKLTRFSDFALYDAGHDCYGVVRFEYPHDGEFEVQVEIKGKQVSKITVSINDIEYYYLVRIAAFYHDKGGAKGAMLDLLDVIKHPMPPKHISIEISE